MNSKRWKAATAVAAVMLLTVLTLSAIFISVDADPQALDDGEQTVTYRPNGASGDSYQHTYHGIASTEYNPLYWSSSTGENDWDAPVASNTFTLQTSSTIRADKNKTTAVTLNASNWTIESISVSTSSNYVTATVNNYTSISLVNSSRNTNYNVTLTFQITAQDADVKKCFAGWENPSTGIIYMPGDVIPADVTVLDAVWVNPYWFAANSDQATVSNKTVTLPNPTSNTVTARVYNNAISTTGSYIESTETPTMYNKMYAINTGGTVNSTSIGVGTYRSYDINSPITMTVNNIGLTGDAIFDSMEMIASATGAGTTHGDSTTSSIKANGHILILGTGLTMTNNNYYKAVQVIGGSVNSSITKSVISGKNIVSRTLDDFSVHLGTCVIIHSGYYYNIVAGGSRYSIGSANTNLSTYLVMKGGTVLDTVVGACGASNGKVYGSAGTDSNTSVQGGTFIYNTGAIMPGDYWEEGLLGNDSEDYMRFKLKESTILEGGGSDTGGDVLGCTHVFLSDEASVYDAQAGPRRSQCQVTCTFMEISGNALVKHVACGTVTDGNNTNNDRTSVTGVEMNVCDNPLVANLFGAGYDTFYKANKTTMPKGSITVNISGGTFGSVYGGGYRGYVGTENDTKVNITINITGGHVLDSVYGGGRGGVDKICHNNDGTNNWGESDTDTTGKSYVYGTTTVNISGGTIDGSVYGGGESVPKLRQYSAFTETIQSAPDDVAAVYGTTTVNISGNAVINGSVYGAGKGIDASKINDDGTSAVYNSQNYVINSAGELDGLEWMGNAYSISYYDTSIGYSGYAKVTVSSTVNVAGSAMISGSVYGGGAFGVSETSSVNVEDGSIDASVFGGGLGAENVVSVTGNTSVEVSGGSIGQNVYGGCCNGVTGADSHASIFGGEIIGSVYGGGLGYLGVRSVVGSSEVVVNGNGAMIHGNVYGGCENGMTLEMSTARIIEGTVLGDVYAGGLGSTSYISVRGKRYVYITGGRVEGSVYGGSSLGNDASDLVNINNGSSEAGSSAYVFVANGEIGGSVYGGGYKGKTTGTTYIYIGYSDAETKVSGKTIVIGNSVYGGGDVGELGVNDTPFSDTMVYGGSNVYVYGGTNSITFTGTISAAGNSCNTEGDTSVTIESLSLDSPIESIQRADSVHIIASELTFNGKISGLTGDNTRYSFYSIGDLCLQAGTVIDLNSPLKNIGKYRSLNADGMETRSSSPMNRINICNGTMFEIYTESGGDITYNKVHGYTILSILTIEDYYGAVTLGSRDSPGGFVIEKNGIYTVADITDFDRCRCWFIAGVLQTVTSSTLMHDPNAASGSLIDDGSQYVTVPTLAKSTLIRYTGGFMISDNYHLIGGTSLTSGQYAVKVGTKSDDGRTDVLGLVDEYGNYVGAFIPDVYDSSCEVFMERPAQQPVLQITVYGLNENVNRYVGYATIFLQEVVPVEYKITEDTSRFEYIVQNKVEIRVDIYSEGSDTNITIPPVQISTVQGGGTADIILPAGLNDNVVYLKSATTDLPVGSALTVATVKNNGATTGWNSPLREYDVTNGHSGDRMIMQSLTGAYIATIRFSVTGFTAASDNETHTQTFVFVVVDTSGDESEFTVELTIKKHPQVSVIFYDTVAQLERSYSFEYGTVISESDCPNTLDNFVGWYTDPTHYNRYNFNIPLTADITRLYASYMYTVTFDNMNGTESTMYVETSGDMKIGKPEPTWDGYTFVGWYNERELINEWDFDNDTVTQDMTLYAKWLGMEYQVFFKYKLGDDPEQILDYSITVTYGSEYGNGIRVAIGKVNDITGDDDRYQFVRWQLEQQGSSSGIWEDTICTPSRQVYHDDVNDYYYYYLYAEFTDTAIWIQLESPSPYNGASIAAPVRYLMFPDGDTYTFMGNNATLAGWRITGWSLMDGNSVVRTVEIGTDYEFELSDVSSYLVDNTLTFHANWERITYTVTIIHPSGGNITVYKDGVAYNNTLTAYYGNVLQLNYVAEDGFTFTKWMVNGQGTPENINSAETTMEVIGNCAIYVQLKTLESVTVKLAIDGGNDDDPASVNLYLCENIHTTYKLFVPGSVVQENGVYYRSYNTSVKLGLFYVCIMGADGALYELGLIDVVDSDNEGITVTINAVSITSNVTGAPLDVPLYTVPDAHVPIVLPENYEVAGALTVTGASYDPADGYLVVPHSPSSGITITGTLRLVARVVTLDPVIGFTYEMDGEEVSEIEVPHGMTIDALPSIYDSDRYIVGSSQSDYTLVGWFYDRQFTHPVSLADEITADTTIYPQILEKTSIQYTVRIFLMGLDGSYPVNPTRTANPEAKDGQTTDYDPPSFEGFRLVTDSSEYIGFIAEEDVVIDLMYERITADDVSISLGNGTASLTGWTFVAGTPNRLTKTSVYYGETITLPQVTLTGYTHSGWTVNGDPLQGSSITISTVSNGELVFPTVTAVLDINTYTLTLNTPVSKFSNGSTVKTMQVTYGTVISEIEGFEQPAAIDQYTFSCWKEGQVVFDISSAMPARTLTLTANWTLNTYRVTFTGDANTVISASYGGESFSSGDMVPYGTIKFAVKFASKYTYQSHTVTGSQEVSFTHTDDHNYVLTVSLTADTVVTFVSQDLQFHVRYSVDGVYQQQLDQNGSEGSTVFLQSYSRTGYNFYGWYSDSQCTESVALIENISRDWVLYGRTSPIEYTVSFNANGGTGDMEGLVLTYDSPMNLTANTYVLNGSVFFGWATSNNGSALYADQQSVLNIALTDITLYAVWITVTPYSGVYDGAGHSPIVSGSDITVYFAESALDENNYNTGTEDAPSYVQAGTYTVYYYALGENLGFAGTVTVTIDKVTPVLTVDPRSLTYTGSAQQLVSGSVSVGGVTILYRLGEGQYSSSVPSATNAGEYVVWFKSEATANYNAVAEDSVNVTIAKATVTIVMEEASKLEGQDDPAFNGTIDCASASTAVLGITFIRTNAGTESVGVYNDVITAIYTPNANYQVNITTARFTIIGLDWVQYIVVKGQSVTTENVSTIAGTAFPDKTVSGSDGYSFYEWVRIGYDGGRIVSSVHVTYSPVLESELIAPGTYIAMFVTGDSISFDANCDDATGTMTDQTFTDRSGTLKGNAFERPGYMFIGWATSDVGEVVYTDRVPMTQIIGLSTTDNDNVLYAVWSEYTYTSSLTWNVDGSVITSNGSFLRTDNEMTYAIIRGDASATISEAWLDVLASTPDMKLYVELEYGSITFDEDCITYFASLNEDVTFSIRPVRSGAETFDVSSGSSVVVMYNITASYIHNGTKTFIHELGGIATVTVDNLSGGNSVAYIGVNGGQPTVTGYDAESITFTTDHFSLYEISERTEPAVQDEVTKREDASTILLIGAVTVIMVMAMAIMNIGRRH